MFGRSTFKNLAARDRISISLFTRYGDDVVKIAVILPCEPLLFSPLFPPCLSTCSDTFLVIRPPASCRYRCPRPIPREDLHLAENSLQDLSFWYSSDLTFDRWVLERESSDTQLSVSPNDLSWLFGPCVHVKTYKRQSSAAVTQQNKPNALGKRTLVSGRYDWSNCYNSLLMFFQIRWCYCLRSIRDQNGANNSNAFLKLFFVGQYKGI